MKDENAQNGFMVINMDMLDMHTLCAASGVTSDFIDELIAFGILEPFFKENEPAFLASHVTLIRKAYHLHRDLEINLAGIALAMELMQEMEALRNKVSLLEKHCKPF